MSKFAKAVSKENNKTRTTNGMKAFKSTKKATLDYFAAVGGSRGTNVAPTLFGNAFKENRELALRVAMFARDVRGGAGERQHLRDVLEYLSSRDVEATKVLMNKVPEIGRWDDLLVVKGTELKHYAYDMIKAALNEGNGLCAKWMPRKGNVAAEMRNYFGWTPKFYRKTLVGLTKVVETQMCDKEWSSVEYSKIPSLAFSRYRKAFGRNDQDRFVEFLEKANKGEVKINTSAVYPYDVLKGVYQYRYNNDATTRSAVVAQWNQMPVFESKAKVLPMIDVSGSMACPAGGSKSVSCMDAAVSLGLYLSEKCEGPLQNCVVTYTSTPRILNLKGDVVSKVGEVMKDVGYSTNIEAAFKAIVEFARKNNLTDEDMPDYLMVFSDMQFNCSQNGGTSFKVAEKLYEKYGYKMPKLVYWNLNDYGNVQVKHNKDGACLVSGFSPAIAETIMQADPENFDPYQIMLKAIMNPRYDF